MADQLLTFRAPRFDATFRRQLHELFRWRRDVRRFRTESLEEGLVDQLITLALLAPSVGNSQPWRFVTVEDNERRRRSAAASRSATAMRCLPTTASGRRRTPG